MRCARCTRPMNNDMIALPRSSGTARGGSAPQFPLLGEDPRVLGDWWQGRPHHQPPPKPPRRDPQRAALPVRLVRAVAKGVPLGIIVAAVVLGAWPARQWWLVDWRWVIALAVVLAVALVRVNAAALLAVGIALVQAAGSLMGDFLAGGPEALSAHLHVAAKVVLIVIAARVAWEVVRGALWTVRR